MKVQLTTILTGVALAAPLAIPTDAQASLEACGDIHVEAQAECELVAEGCELECTPLSVEAACAAELYAGCEGSCDFDADIECTTSCQGSCEAQCAVDPGAFDCNAACQADCEGGCSARCSSDDSECWASCEATCSAECTASCEVTPPDADCEAQCQGCCGGSCRAEINLGCQVDCQAEAYAECKVDLQGGCEADCSDAGAALFCDGKYVDYGNNFEECLDAIESLLDGEVEGRAALSCEDGECALSADGLFACSVSDHSRDAGAFATMFVLFGLGLGARRRWRAS